MTRPSPLRLAVLGSGAMARVHAEAYRSMPGVEVAAVFGRTAATTGALAGAVSAAAVSRYGDILEDPSIVAVDVCLPTPEHAAFVLPALAAGKHVFCETPLALDPDEAKTMRDAARRTGRILSVALLVRSIASYAEVRRRVRSGAIGTPVSASAYRLGSYLVPGAPDHRGHYSDPTTELMTFDVDALNWIFRSPLEVTARSTPAEDGTPGHVFATLQYDRFVASVEAGGLMPVSYPFTLGLRVVGTAGALEMKTVLPPDGLPEVSLTSYPAEGSPRAVALEDVDPYEAECRLFVDCVRGGADPALLDVDRAIEALDVCIAVQESLRENGRSVRVRRQG